MKNKKLLIFLIIGLLVLIGSQALAPLVMTYTGKSIFIIPQSESQIGKRALDIMDVNGIYASGDEWKSSKDGFYQEVENVQSREDLIEILERAIKVAGGKHSFIMDEQTKENLEKDYQRPEVKLEDNILYIELPAHMGTLEMINDYANTIGNSFKKEGIQGVIIDLRNNTGGNMYPMILGISPLLPDGQVLSFIYANKVENPISIEDGKFPILKGLEIDNKEKYDLPVAVLIGENTASSGEMTLMATAGIDRIKSFGKKTAGYNSANSGFHIDQGLDMYLTIGFTKDRAGKLYKEDPIDPDIETDKPLEDGKQWLEMQIK